MMNAANIAATIQQQIASNNVNRFAMMTGAKDFMSFENGLQFGIAKANDGINKVRIELTPADTYTVAFYSIRKSNVRVVSSHEGVYAEDLRRVFESTTGLYTTL